MMDPDSIHDLFAYFRPVAVRRMFGGAGIFADSVMFGLVAEGVIYLKSDEDNAADFDREGLPPFTYHARNGTRAVMSYRKIPERLYDDPDELAQWAARSLAVAQRKVSLKPKATRTARRSDHVRRRPGG